MNKKLANRKKYLQSSVSEVEKVLTDFLFLLQTNEKEVNHNSTTREELAVFDRLGLAMTSIFMICLFLVPIQIAVTKNPYTIFVFPVLLLLHKMNERLCQKNDIQTSSQAFSDWYKTNKKAKTTAFWIVKRGRSFDQYRLINQLVQQLRGVFSLLTGKIDREAIIRQEKTNHKAPTKKRLELEFIDGAHLFLELLETLPTEIIDTETKLYLPSSAHIKFAKASKHSLAKSHLLIETDQKLYGVEVLGDDFIAFPID
ncbi:hypothetical protein BAU15_15180 [Enterococcus sp. JM4C]|uniref:hypothetical protein n=1 Tax=Candidatus Enterococcus huntleyi TaxID=1857217 RepID=UPI00137A03DF|nr:hypothetical protein [Enterococcus sp. JM4C]KAF1296955.1 hypothetical protein BAU15_15180 [Enterococcus sp. JM4C]